MTIEDEIRERVDRVSNQFDVRYISDVLKYYAPSIDMEVVEKVIKAVDGEYRMGDNTHEYRLGIKEMITRLELILMREQ